MTSKILRVIVPVGLLVFALPVQANLITNGSFEQGYLPGGRDYTVYAPNSTTITGWTVSDGSVDYIGWYWQAAEGNRSLDLSGFSLGTIYQDFPTTPGTEYFVRFALAGNPDLQPRITTVRVWVDDPTVNYADFT